jgi:adenylate kinase
MIMGWLGCTMGIGTAHRSHVAVQFGLAHISAGDLLRAEVAAGTEAGKRAEGFMKAGELVPDEVVITMVKNRLAEDDAQTKGWLLDGYPRSASQAAALKEAGIEPDIFLLLEVFQA